MQSSDEASCSDYKIKIIETTWKELLLKWINDCVAPVIKARELDARTLVEVINKYKEDICDNDVDRAILCSDDVEPFLKFKYPLLRLRYLSEPASLPKKLYVMTSVLLYYCCVNSKDGEVDRDICRNLTKIEQELVLRFCECLSEVEITISNIEYSVKEAFETVAKFRNKKKQKQTTVKRRSYPRSPSDSEAQSSYSLKPPTALDSVVVKPPKISFNSSATISQSSNPTDPSSVSSSELDLSEYVTKMREMTDDFKAAVTDNTGVKVRTVPKSRRRIKSDECYRTTTEVKKTHDNSDKLCCDSRDVCCSLPTTEKTGEQVDNNNDGNNNVVLCCSSTKEPCFQKYSGNQNRKKWFLITFLTFVAVFILLCIAYVLYTILTPADGNAKVELESELKPTGTMRLKNHVRDERLVWQYRNGFCQKVHKPSKSTKVYQSPARCVLLGPRPQLWPQPIGETRFGKTIASFSTKNMKHKFESVPSEKVGNHLAEAFQLFTNDLLKLEKSDVVIDPKDLSETKNVTVIINVESDPDPRLRLNTDESYTIQVKPKLGQLQVSITSTSFCGVRHGLETLSQMIVFDQSTGLLITLTSADVKDSPSYRYRGLMIDSARNYIPIPDLIRTIDAMAASKLNTFHWRISDATSFPLLLPNLEQLFQYGAYDASKVYTKQMVEHLVKRARVRGIRVVIEVAAPGPVGKPWSWSKDVACPNKTASSKCNELCVRMKTNDDIFDILQQIYTNIIEVTEVDDVFHLSDSIFPLTYCSSLIEDRIGFLDKALDRLKVSNKGFLPKLPIIWYTDHLKVGSEARAWDMLGVQLADWHPTRSEKMLSRFKVVHSSRWDLSCEMKKNRCIKYRTWQQMYSWKQWETLETFLTEGGEAVLWTDIVDSGNLDEHLWPRTAAVAERLWSNIVLNSTATSQVYARLDTHMWRMLLRDVNFQPVWPVWCSFNPGKCALKINE